METTTGHLKRRRGRYCSRSCAGEARWQRKQTSRYRTRSLIGHPLADEYGRVGEHRLVLFDRIGPGRHRCHWCRGWVCWEDGSLWPDHLNNQGRDNRPENLVPSCMRCNMRRHHPTRIKPGERVLVMPVGRRLRPVNRPCQHCGQTYQDPASGRFCSRTCSRHHRLGLCSGRHPVAS